MSSGDKKERKAVIIGLGNPYAGDDAVGYLSMEALQKAVKKRLEKEESYAKKREKVIFKEVSAGGLYLTDFLLDFTHALIIDAVAGTGRPEGTVMEMGPDELSFSLNTSSPHDTNFATALAYCKANAPERVPNVIKIIGVEIIPPSQFTEDISPRIEEAIPEVVEKGLRILTEWGFI